MAAARADIDNSEGGQRLRNLETAKQQSIGDRATAAQASNDEAQQAIAAAQDELAALMRKQAELAAAYTPPEPGQAPTPVQKAIGIQPAKVVQEMKSDVGSTASFNSRIAGLLAANAGTRIDQQQLDALRQIADNTADLDEVGTLA